MLKSGNISQNELHGLLHEVFIQATVITQQKHTSLAVKDAANTIQILLLTLNQAIADHALLSARNLSPAPLPFHQREAANDKDWQL